MIVIDLFSGLGGFSEAFLRRGHTVLRIDLNPKFSSIPHTIIGDVKELPLKREISPDILLMSPPCQEFARFALPWIRTAHEPSVYLIEKALEAKEYLHPKNWILECNKASVEFIARLIGQPVKICGPYYLWGSFPIFDCVIEVKKQDFPGTKPELRAKIPYNLSLALCIALEWGWSC